MKGWCGMAKLALVVLLSVVILAASCVDREEPMEVEHALDDGSDAAEPNRSDGAVVLDGEVPASGGSGGGDGSGQGGAVAAEGGSPSFGPAQDQWYACQCGGPCAGAEEPQFNFPYSCNAAVGEHDAQGRYVPCANRGCGIACIACDPMTADCGASDGDETGTLCDKAGSCVQAADANCL